MSPALGRIEQLGYVVDDLDAGVGRWIGLMGVGPWLVFRNVRLSGRYLGRPTLVAIDVALSYQDDMQIELIQPTSSAPSPYRGADGALREGLHHIAWTVDDRDAAVAGAVARGLTPVFEAENATTKVAYLAPAQNSAVLYEVIAGAATRALMAEGVARSRAWHGSHPVTEIDLASA